MPDSTLEEALRELAAAQRKISEVLEKRSTRKDIWDRFATLSAFLSSVVIAAVGLTFTSCYNKLQSDRNAAAKEQEIRIAQIQTLEKFVPHLTGTEQQKKIAIIAMSSLGNTKLATDLAVLYPSEGTLAGLKAIAGSGNENASRIANEALQAIFERQRKAIVQIASESSNSRFQPFASGALINSAGYILTADYNTRVSQSVKLRVITSDGTIYDATVVDSDKDIGLAVLKIPGSNHEFVRLSNPSLKLEESVLAIGTKGRIAVEPATGVVKAIDSRFVEIVFETDITGFGGGPVFNSDGLMVAMIHSLKGGTTPKVDQCVRGDVIRSYLAKLNVEPFTFGE